MHGDAGATLYARAATLGGEAGSAHLSWKTWINYQLPYAAFAYAYFPITLTKRILLHPRRARHDVMVRRFWNRWGWMPTECPSANGSRPVWVHMNSGGEAMMAQSLLRRFEERGRVCWLSTDSYDAQRLLRRWYGPERVVFPPWDTGLPVRRALGRLNPKALVFVGNAYFPRLLAHARRRGVTTILVNAVLSRNVDVANRWLRRALAMGVHRLLDAIAVQGEADYEAFRALGVPAKRLVVTGKLEGDLAHIRLTPEERQRLRRSLGLNEQDPVMIVGSVHPGEESVLLEAFRAIRRQLPSARLVVAPRWLHDASAMETRLSAQGWTVARRTALARGEWRAGDPYDVLVLDTFGELRMLYGIADVAFIGSSLVPINARKGGHNVLEPLAHGVPPLFGPHMNLWRGATDPLLEAWPGLEVDSASTLAERALDVITQRAPLQAIRSAGERVTQRDSGAVNRTLAFVDRLLGGL